MSGLNSPMILLQTRCLGSCGLLTMTMSPRDRVLNNELVTNKVNKVEFNSIHDFLEMVFILPTINVIVHVNLCQKKLLLHQLTQISQSIVH